MQIVWQWKTYDELSKSELYHILQLRNEIFIVEKKCPWNEVDGHDEDAFHLLGYDVEKSTLVAYARLSCPKNINEPVHFGRVLVVQEHRGKGIGKIIIENIFEKITVLGYQSNRIDILVNYTPATEKLYSSFGFYPKEEPYQIEGGSKLVSMSRSPLLRPKSTKRPEKEHYRFYNVAEVNDFVSIQEKNNICNKP